jgi:hypothetical protein
VASLGENLSSGKPGTIFLRQEPSFAQKEVANNVLDERIRGVSCGWYYPFLLYINHIFRAVLVPSTGAHIFFGHPDERRSLMAPSTPNVSLDAITTPAQLGALMISHFA